MEEVLRGYVFLKRLLSTLYCTTISASIDTKGSDSDLGSGQTMETILGIECDAKHYGRHEHQPVYQTPSAFYDRQ